MNKYSLIAGSRSQNSANFGSWTADCTFFNRVHATASNTMIYTLWNEQNSSDSSFFFLHNFAQLSEPCQGLWRIFSTLMKGLIKRPHGETTREIPFDLGRFGIALENSSSPRRLSIVQKSSAFRGCISTAALFGWALLRPLRMCPLWDC